MIRNFFNTLRRFQMSSALNILGLSIAFAAFMLIMVQVKWDMTYDAGHPGSDRIYRLETTVFAQPGEVAYSASMNRPIGEKINDLTPQIEMAGCIQMFGNHDFYTINGGQQPDRKLKHALISSSIIDIFDLKAVQGSFKRFREEPNMVILSQKQANAIFGDNNPIDRQLYGRMDTLTVAAVFKDLPENSYLMDDRATIIINVGKQSLENWGEWSYQYFVRLQNASDLNAVNTKAQSLCATLRNNPPKVRLSPLTDIHFNTDIKSDTYPKGNRSTSYLLIAVACLILGIAVINFINFFVAMVPIRIRSINISKVFGAATGTLRTILVFEAVAMMLLSAIVGVGIAWVCSETPITEYISGSIGFPALWPVVWGTLSISLVMGFVSGLFPAIYITSFPAVMVLRGAFGRSRAGQRLRIGLVGVQYVISVVMIISALFVNIQTSFLLNHDMGYNRENIIVAYVGNKIGANTKVLLDRVKSNPLIIDVAFADNQLASQNPMSWGRFYKDNSAIFDCFMVSHDFPKFMGIKVLEGRDFVPEDDNKPGTYLFNQTAKRKYGFAPGDQLGGHDTVNATVAGIVKDFAFNSLQYSIKPMGLYVMGGKNKWRNMRWAYFRTAAGTDLAEMRKYLEKTILQLNPAQVEVDIVTFDDHMNKIYDKENKLSGMITWFSGLAIIISLMGVFGLVLFETQYRRKEIGIRKIHGSTVAQILMMFNRRFVWIVAGSFAVAVPLCVWGVNWWLSGFAYRTPMHWWVFLIGGLAIFAITVATVTVQSYRSATENPVKCLKSE